MPLGKAKGSLLVHLRGYVERNHGESGWGDLIRRLPPEDARELDGILMVGVWYPVGIWNRALEKYLATNHPDPIAAMMELCRYIAQKDVLALHRMFLKVGSPAFIMRQSGSIWSRYFDTGRFAATEIRPRQWRLELDAPLSEDSGPSSYTCEGVRAWLAAAVQLTGTTLTITQTHCRFQRAPVCVFEASW